ncbi:MAG: phosphoenolpyruvate carboxykinase domain-containing protein, partial [Mycobacterium sp.]
WLDMGTKTHPDLLPKIFSVNWFRRGDDGTYLWPGFGENSRVLKWALQRIDGTADAVRTPIGDIPTADGLDLDGLDALTTGAKIAAALDVDTADWTAETQLIDQWYSRIGDRLPDALRHELAALKSRLADAQFGHQN